MLLHSYFPLKEILMFNVAMDKYFVSSILNSALSHPAGLITGEKISMQFFLRLYTYIFTIPMNMNKMILNTLICHRKPMNN